MRRILLVCLLLALVGCNSRTGPREDTRVKILETGRLGGTPQKPPEKDP